MRCDDEEVGQIGRFSKSRRGDARHVLGRTQNASQEKKDYRAALRSLPQDYDTANEAADAWAEFDIPE